MRGLMRVAFLVLLIALVGAVGYGIWNNGYDQGLIDGAASSTEIIVTEPRGGYFPFGAVFGFFFLFLLFGLMFKAAFGWRHWGGHHRGYGPGGYRSHMEERMKRWHDEAHHGSGRGNEPSDQPGPVS